MPLLLYRSRCCWLLHDDQPCCLISCTKKHPESRCSLPILWSPLSRRVDASRKFCSIAPTLTTACCFHPSVSCCSPTTTATAAALVPTSSLFLGFISPPKIATSCCTHYVPVACTEVPVLAIHRVKVHCYFAGSSGEFVNHPVHDDSSRKPTHKGSQEDKTECNWWRVSSLLKETTSCSWDPLFSANK
ncbi:hypothetical protein NL676_007550 [Syzygium grande]|nr:hypothetical protein NL676_007550 [Syzygium grande]